MQPIIVNASELAAAADLHRHVSHSSILRRAFRELHPELYAAAVARNSGRHWWLHRFVAIAVSSSRPQLQSIIQEDDVKARRSGIKRVRAEAVARFEAAVQLQTRHDVNAQLAAQGLQLDTETITLLVDAAAAAAAAPGATAADVQAAVPSVSVAVAEAALQCTPCSEAMEACRHLIAHRVKEFVSKERGVQQEPAALQAVQGVKQLAVTETNAQLYSCSIECQGLDGEPVSVQLRGKVDGWLVQEEVDAQGRKSSRRVAIVEVKNRQGRRLNRRVRSFELVQMLAYMQLTKEVFEQHGSSPKCCFLERCGKEHWSCDVVWDAKCERVWEGMVLPGLQRFVQQLQLLARSESEQDRLLQGLLL